AGPDIDRTLILALRHAGMPIVLVDNALPQTPVDVVLSDDQEGAAAIVGHLLAHGHKRIAFLGGPPTWISTAERAKGYREALAAAGHGAAAIVVHEEETTVASGYAATSNLLAQRTRPAA